MYETQKQWVLHMKLEGESQDRRSTISTRIQWAQTKGHNGQTEQDTMNTDRIMEAKRD